MRLIDADALRAQIMMDAPDFMDGGSTITKAFILAMIGTRSITPTIDATPIVRCNKCKYSDWGVDEEGKSFLKCLGRCYGGVNPDWFCGDGEIKEV